MRRFFLTSLLFALYLLFSVDSSQCVYVQGEDFSQCSLSAATDSNHSDLEMLREWGSDMLRSVGSRSVFQTEVSHSCSTQHHLRHRNSSENKIVPHIEPCRHLGHVTNIFDFDNFRSSLGNGYYLHTLCRLRI